MQIFPALPSELCQLSKEEQDIQNGYEKEKNRIIESAREKERVAFEEEAFKAAETKAMLSQENEDPWVRSAHGRNPHHQTQHPSHPTPVGDQSKNQYKKDGKLSAKSQQPLPSPIRGSGSPITGRGRGGGRGGGRDNTSGRGRGKGAPLKEYNPDGTLKKRPPQFDNNPDIDTATGAGEFSDGDYDGTAADIGTGIGIEGDYQTNSQVQQQVSIPTIPSSSLSSPTYSHGVGTDADAYHSSPKAKMTKKINDDGIDAFSNESDWELAAHADTFYIYALCDVPTLKTEKSYSTDTDSGNGIGNGTPYNATYEKDDGRIVERVTLKCVSIKTGSKFPVASC
jgi:hypothetical protein